MYAGISHGGEYNIKSHREFVIAYAGRGREGENRALSMRRGLTKGMDLRIVWTLPTLETPSESDYVEMMPSPQQFDEAESENDPLAHLSEFHQGFFEARKMLSDPEPAMSQGEIERRAEAIVDAIVENQTARDAVDWLSTMLGEAAEDQQQSQSTLQQEVIEATTVNATDTGAPPQLNVHIAEPDMRFGEWYPGKEFPTVQTVVLICGGGKRDEDVRDFIHRYADPDLDCVVIDIEGGGYAKDEVTHI